MDGIALLKLAEKALDLRAKITTALSVSQSGDDALSVSQSGDDAFVEEDMTMPVFLFSTK